MSSMIGRIVRQSSLYAVSNILLKLSGLFLSVFYLNDAYLSPTDYAHFGLLEVTAQLAILIVGCGLGAGLIKFLTDLDYEADHASLPFTALLATILLAGSAFGVLWLVAPALAGVLLTSAEQGYLVQYMALYVCFKVIAAIPVMLMRIRERVGLYVLAMVAEMVLLVGGVYYGLVVQGLGLEGIMRAFAVSSGVSMVVLVGGLLSQITWTFNGAFIRPLFKYGVPLIMASLASHFLNVGDRYLIEWLATSEDLAIYQWGAKLGGTLNMLFVQSFQLAFSVLGLKSLGAGQVHVHRRVFRHYVIWTGWAVLGLSLLTYDVTHLLVVAFDANPIYLEAELLVFPLALGFMAYGMYVVVINVLYAAGKTRAISQYVLVAAALNAVLNLALIPLLGGLGAALVTYVAYLVLALISARAAEREIKVGYPWRAYMLTLVLVGVLFVAGQLTGEMETGMRLGLRVGLIVAYVPLLLVVGLYRRDEVSQGWIAIKHFVQKRRKS